MNIDITDRKVIPTNDHERLATASINKLLFEFSIPAIIGMVVNALYNIVSRIFIGRSPELSVLGLAALTIAFPIMMIMSGISLLFGAGGGTLLSIKLGEHNNDSAQKVLGNAISMIIISSLIVTAIGLLFMKPILYLFGASVDTMPLAIEYMRIILFASLTQGVSIGCNHLMRADGSPRSSMISMFIGAGFNIVFTYIFIFIFHMGMTGAALATIGGQSLSALWGITHFVFRSKVKLKLKNMIPDGKLIPRIMLVGLPICCTHISNSLLNIVLNKQIGYYGGDIAVSSMGIITSLNQFIILPITGIHHGAQPIIGYNRGAGNYSRIKQTLRKSITIATALCIVAFILTRIIPHTLIGLFGTSPELIAFGSQAMHKWFLLLPVVGFQSIVALYFQAVGKSEISLFLTFTRQLLFLIPFIYLLGHYFGINGILYAAPVTDGLSFTITFLFFLSEIRRLNLMTHSPTSMTL